VEDWESNDASKKRKHEGNDVDVEKKVKMTSSPSPFPTPSLTSSKGEEKKQRVVTTLTAYGVSDRGKKHYQQDTKVTIHDCRDISSSLNNNRYSYFAIYDGHGGEFSSNFLSEALHVNMIDTLSKSIQAQFQSVNNNTTVHPSEDPALVRRVILDSYHNTDKQLLIAANNKKADDGSCAICCLVLGQTVWISNVGDCRAILARSKTKANHSSTSTASTTPTTSTTSTPSVTPKDEGRKEKPVEREERRGEKEEKKEKKEEKNEEKKDEKKRRKARRNYTCHSFIN